MKNFRSTKIAILVLLAFFWTNVLVAAGYFVTTDEGIRYVIKDNNGKVTQVIKPEFDAPSGKYQVKDKNNKIIAVQNLPNEAAMHQFKIVTPIEGSTHSVKTKDFMGNSVPVLKELSTKDPRYIQLKQYIESNPGLSQTVSMQVKARDFKIRELQSEVTAGTKDPEFAKWLTNDLKKPVYLEVGDSGSIYHDPRGFVIAEDNAGGDMAYRDNSHVNRLVVPSNSEVFNGGMKDPSAASVMSHEVGHMIMDQLYERPNYPKTNYYGGHSKNSVTDEGFAISEGWAEAIEALSTKNYHGMESPPWRIKTHKNIAENKYIFENMGVTSGPNDGILKSGQAMMSTEGVNASLFYDVLNSNRIQAPYEKVVKVFEQSKPQTYREFVDSYINKYPEDRSQMIKQFLENTKYTTIDTTAKVKYKQVHDAKQAYINATDPNSKAQLKSEYQNKLTEYNQWKNQLYKKAVVEGKVDSALDATRNLSDETSSEYRSIRLSETLLKSKKALGVGLQNAASSMKQSFSAKNMAMTAGTSIAMNLASQMMNGKKPSVKTALKSVASLQFVGNVVGSSLGAAAGQVVTPLIQTFVPIPVVGTIAGALIPTMTAIAGGSFGGNLGAGMSFKQALKALDPVAIAGQSVGSAVGAILGSMIPIPVVGTMLGSIVGGIVGEKLFSSIARLFGRKKDKITQTETEMPKPVYFSNYQAADQLAPPQSIDTRGDSSSSADPYGVRIPENIDRIPYNKMHPNLRKVKDIYENAYKAYVKAASSGNQTEAKKKLDEFLKQKARYKRALGAYTK
ncbi:MAG: sulfite exporter TauE/SafE family protein [Candidatus Rifleibacteriota bacterium]